MKALIVGGTGFLGSAITENALLNGFEVDVLTRKNITSNDHKLTYIQGDRYDKHPGSIKRTYDVVFDTCGFEPNAIRSVLDKVDTASLKKYVFISSASVYDDYSNPLLSEGVDLKGACEKDLETANSLPFSERTSAMSFGDSYGPLKRECEILLTEILGDKAILLRSGLLVGAGDYTDRLTWWVRRVDKAGEVVCPLPEARLVQLIDVGDAAKFAVQSVTNDLAGIFNLTGHQLTFSKLLDVMNSCSKNGAKFKWVDLSKYSSLGLSCWTDIPLVLPNEDQFRFFFDISIEKALANGLELRNVKETLEDVLSWDRSNRSSPLKCGYDARTEESLSSQ